MSQTGTPSVLVIVPNQDQLNGLVDALKQANYQVAGATAVDAGITAAQARRRVRSLPFGRQSKAWAPRALRPA